MIILRLIIQENTMNLNKKSSQWLQTGRHSSLILKLLFPINTGDKKKQEQKPAQRVADFDLASGMAFTAEENSNNEMMSYSDIEQAIPNLTPQEFYMPASASNLQSGAFLTSEQRAQRDAAAKRSRDALGITIIP